MKKLLLWVLLIGSALGQQVNTDVIPASTGLNLGHSNQRWNVFAQNLDVSGNVIGNLTFPGTITFSGTPAFNNGASLSGTFSGNPIFSGSPVFSGSVTFSATNNTFTGSNTFSGPVSIPGGSSNPFTASIKTLNNIQFADQFAGSDCGAKINAADSAIGANGGIIMVDARTCGTVWSTLVSISAGHTLRFISAPGAAPEVLTSAGISLDGTSAGLDGQSSSLNNVLIAAANGSNLPYVVRMNGAFQSLTNIEIDGNLANNPTGGAAILVTNSAIRPFFHRVNAQNAPSFGIYFNSTGAVFDGHMDNSYILSNQGGGLMLRNTTDLFIDNTALDVNGSIGTVNTQNAATGGCAANCVTWVSGPKWTTDSSLVGTKIIIGTTFYFISSIQSATVLTISAAPGTQSGVNYGIGANIELSDSPGLRLEHSDIGGGGSCGLWIYGTAAGKQSTREIIGPGNQFGNTNNHDICIAGWDVAGANYAAGQFSIIQGNSFIGLITGATTNKWDHIYCIDCTNLQIVDNNMFSLNNPLQNKAAIEYVENLNAEGTKARPAIIEGNYFSDVTAGNWSLTGSYGTAKIINSTANGMSGQVLWSDGFAGNPLASIIFCDEGYPTDTLPCKFLNVVGVNGTLQWSNNAYSPIWTMTDAGAVSSSNPYTGINSFSGNTAALTADWTCGTGGTVASCTSATIIGSGGGVPLTFTLPSVARSYTLECDGVVGQATAVTANQWNLLTATNGATNVTANYSMATAATSSAYGAVTDQASTTTTFQITPSWTLGAITTKMPFHVWAKIEGASASGTVVSFQLVAPTVGDLVTIYRGTACRVF